MGDPPIRNCLIVLTWSLEMKLRYLTVAALAAGLFAAQPVLAQSMAHDSPPKTSHTHKKKTTKKPKKKKTTQQAPAPTQDQ